MYANLCVISPLVCNTMRYHVDCVSHASGTLSACCAIEGGLGGLDGVVWGAWGAYGALQTGIRLLHQLYIHSS